jgi:hypothetical protein
MRHACVPQSSTPEQLAGWIKENQIDLIVHEEKVQLDDDTTQELEKKSALASRAIMRLEECKKEFMEYIKKGTPVNVPENSLMDPQHQPVPITIPPTKGLNELKKNLEFANKQLEEGYEIISTQVYMIPYPEASIVVGVTITGEEFEYEGGRVYTRDMSDKEVERIKPLLKEVGLGTKPPKKEKPKKEKASFMEEDLDTTEESIQI